jgi:hypothetical protein
VGISHSFLPGETSPYERSCVSIRRYPSNSMVGSGVYGLLLDFFVGSDFFGGAMTASFTWLLFCTGALTGRG